MAVLNTENWKTLAIPSLFSVVELASFQMALLCCSQICPQATIVQSSSAGAEQQTFFAVRSANTEIPCRRISSKARKIGLQWSFLEGSRVVLQSQFQRNISKPKGSFMSAYFLTSSQIASTAFTWGTISVLPFYTLMIFVPRATLTRRVMESNLQYAALGMLYGYLLLLSWTPDTLRILFATKYLLPELPGMTKMFANEMTMASAWIHLLAVDLYAARQVFHDGLKNNVETRHSVTLCLIFCPVGILTHAITKVLTKSADG